MKEKKKEKSIRLNLSENEILSRYTNALLILTNIGSSCESKMRAVGEMHTLEMLVNSKGYDVTINVKLDRKETQQDTDEPKPGKPKKN